ncbi:MAG: hypothetical protein ABI986_11470 [Chloroflexota bacterium]
MSRRMILVLLGSLLVMFAQPVQQARAQTKPEVVKVGIYLIRAGSLDITTGAIDVDFYIDFTCEKLCDNNQDKFEVLNGSVKSSVALDLNDKTNPTYRVSATVFQDVDLRQYPFDKHPVKIVIESSLYDSSMVKYVVNKDTSAIDPGVFILGWDLNHTPSAAIVDQYYKAWNLHYTRYVFTAQLSKPALAGWLKGLLPAIIILLGSLFALFITSRNVGNRVAIITSALVASVLYHLNFTSRVPPIGYLTYGDIFMIINYFVLLISLSITIWIIRTDSPAQQPLIARVNKIELVAIPALWLALHILNYLLIIR